MERCSHTCELQEDGQKSSVHSALQSKGGILDSMLVVTARGEGHAIAGITEPPAKLDRLISTCVIQPTRERAQVTCLLLVAELHLLYVATTEQGAGVGGSDLVGKNVYPCVGTMSSYWLPACLSICLSICLSVCLSVYLSICLSLFMSICLSICLS